MTIRSFIKSIESIAKFIKKSTKVGAPSTFRDIYPIGLENLFTGLVDGLWKVLRILTQEWYHLDLVWVVYHL